jgi:uncharacterized membrane protein YeaQ/YmgE (transglycosylase-associated protein family)
MPLYALILWLLIGALAGWLAQRILGEVGPFGLIGDVIIGVIGAIIGGYLLGLLGASGTTGVFVSLLTALIGALLLVWVLGKIVKR